MSVLTACDGNPGRAPQIGDGAFFSSTETVPGSNGRGVQTPDAVWAISGGIGSYTVKYDTDQTTRAETDPVLPRLCRPFGKKVSNATYRPLTGANTGSTGVDVICG